ncbi:MAG: pilus assembly protein [Azoarcus sp.]|jgi:type IV pilus assembly protein PilY1|nr:pilus assembly protein [Azoarcus sp.]
MRRRHLHLFFTSLLVAPGAAAEVDIPDLPLNVGESAPPLVMLVASKDHKLFQEAYADTADLDGDGRVDTGFNPKVEYYGLFDARLCYAGAGQNGGGTAGAAASGGDYFKPAAAVKDLRLKTCGGGLWSGNFLNYVTTTRMDTLRRVLYGGARAVDTRRRTILRRAYVPRDGHAWGKEYAGPAEDGYDISDYTPLPRPTPGRRHFFGNFTPLADCAQAENCRDRTMPVLAVALDVDPGKRVWDWAWGAVGKLFDDAAVGARGSKRYAAQVEACGAAFDLPDGTQGYRGGNCKAYVDAKGVTVWKPTGMLHKFGSSGELKFGLITGSYDKNTSGGVLRKAMSSFADEIDPETGRFTAAATIVHTFDRLMIRGFRANGANEYKNFRGGASKVGGRMMLEGEFPDWGNPVGEMMFEALRYLGGEGRPTPDFDASGGIDAALGLPRATWDDPYAANSAAKAPWCSRPSIVVLSDSAPSFDADQVPGARFDSCTHFGGGPYLRSFHACNRGRSSAFSTPFGMFDAGTLMHFIGEKEGINGNAFFVGQAGGAVDWTPLPRNVDSLAEARGLAPEDPGREGSFTSAAVAYYGRTTGIETAVGKPRQRVDTHVVSLASPLPKIEVPTRRGVVSIAPFAKSVKGYAYNLANTRGYFHVSSEIVKFDLLGLDEKDPANGGRYRARFQVGFSDMEQGGAHEVDFRVEYEVRRQADDSVLVRVTPLRHDTDVTIDAGYVVSGAGAQDGAYLVVQSNRYKPVGYYLNARDAFPTGWCLTRDDKPECATLPACANNPWTRGDCYLGEASERIFTAARIRAAPPLPDPLWLAAKWGGFRDRPSEINHWPDTAGKWDANRDGEPDNFFAAKNAGGLEAALTRAFSTIQDSDSAAGQVAVSADAFGGSGAPLAFTTRYTVGDWSGELVATALKNIDAAEPIGIGQTVWEAAAALPAPAARRIFTRANADAFEVAGRGVAFEWARLDASQQAALASGYNKVSGAQMLDYLRGSDRLEIARGGVLRDRARAGNAQSPLGDSPHVAPLYAHDTHTVYLGANDGMLHAFDAADGRELFAYVPSTLIAKLPTLAHPDYGHGWFVDGEAAVSDRAQTGRSVLVGTLGRGGKGIYALDVDDPEHFDAADVKWELNGVDEAARCKAAPPRHAHMGHALGRPLIVKLNDGKHYALVGNGYNSCEGKAALYVVELDSGKVARLFVLPGKAADNGLAAPAAVDLDGDGMADVAYAGDLRGHLWRFDLAADHPGGWKVDFGGVGKPMFVAERNGQRQPMTAAPAIAVDEKSRPARVFVFVGTGRYLEVADKSDRAVQSWYGLIDDDGAGGGVIDRTDLRQRKFVADGHAILPNGVASEARAVEARGAQDMLGKRGWFIDFDLPADAGERVVAPGLVVKTRRDTVIELPSIVPAAHDPCANGGRGYVNFVSAFTGARLDFAFIDLNGDGVVDRDDALPGGEHASSIAPEIGMPGNLAIVGSQNVFSGSVGALMGLAKNLGGPGFRGRTSWREVSGE